jgi:exonuclease SbcC
VRPLKLELEGFTAFPSYTCLQLSDLDLFAITGPTGAGKSSLIDAIAYALYGRVPRVANQVGDCLSQGLDRMWVQLEFKAGCDSYRVFREYRTKKGPGTVRLERELDGGMWHPLAGRAADVNQRIERIIGLDFDGFSRSILLPQGQFQEFLAGSPQKRREVLGSLLRLDVYDRVRARASASAGDLQQTIKGIDRRLEEDYREATPENLAAMRQQQDAASAEAERVVAELGSLSAALEIAKDLERARGEAIAAKERLQCAERQLAAAEQTVRNGDGEIQTARSKLLEIGARIGATQFDPDRYAALSKAEPIADGTEKLGVQINTATKDACHAQEAVEAAGARAKSASQILDAALARRSSAAEAFHHAQRRNAAALVQQDLASGDSCPVCGGLVGVLPVIDCFDLKAARDAVEKAAADEQSAQQASAKAQADVARAEAQSDAVARTLAQLIERRELGAVQLAQALPDEEDRSIKAIRAFLEQQREAHRGLSQLQTAEAACRKQLEDLERDIDRARQELTRFQTDRDAALGAAKTAAEATKAAKQQLIDLARAQKWTDLVDAAQTGGALTLLERRMGVAQQRAGELQRQLGKLQQQIEQLAEQINTRTTLERELLTLKRDNVVSDLAQMLSANRFQAFVQAEALRLLAEEGSRRLEELSAGRYRLAVAVNGQDFEVIDQWHDDEARSVRTLSGGETFLASLALAVALAETLPGLAANRAMALDSIFLDEGFGSLDPEALDRAADALDSLRARNRMVCVVTHLKELAERLPSRVIVHKSETGSTLEVA